MLRNGTVKCSGYGGDGQLGNGANASSAVPVAVSGLTDAVAVAVGGNTTCAIRNGGTVVCWGNGTNRQLGNGTTTSSNVPVAPRIGKLLKARDHTATLALTHHKTYSSATIHIRLDALTALLA